MKKFYKSEIVNECKVFFYDVKDFEENRKLLQNGTITSIFQTVKEADSGRKEQDFSRPTFKKMEPLMAKVFLRCMPISVGDKVVVPDKGVFEVVGIFWQDDGIAYSETMKVHVLLQRDYEDAIPEEELNALDEIFQ